MNTGKIPARNTRGGLPVPPIPNKCWHFYGQWCTESDAIFQDEGKPSGMAWKRNMHFNGKEFSDVPFRMEKEGYSMKVLHNFPTEFPENYLTV